MPSTMSLDAGTAATGKMREILLRHPEVITVVSQHGRPDNGSDASPFSNVELFAPLKPFDEWPPNLTKEKLTEELQQEFAEELPGIGFNFSQYIQDNVEEALSGVKGANSVKIIGPNLELLEKLATQVMAEMAKVRGRRRSRHLPSARPAQSQHQDRPRKGRALWPQYRRRQHRGAGRARRHHRDHGAGRRPAVQPRGQARSEISQQHRCGS